MTKNSNDLSDDDELTAGAEAPFSGKNQRREPSFSAFDDDDGDPYEEPDRDTDYTSGYRADSVEEEAFEDEFSEEEEDGLFPAEDSDSPYEADQSVAEEPDAWLEKEGYLEEEEEDSGQNWPLSLIAVAVVALVLLLAGGYGVMQQRATTQEELRELRAKLATTASPEDVSASRDALKDMKQSFDKLSAIAEAMTLENRRLADTVAGLEAQLGVQQAVLTKTLPAANQVKPAAVGASASSRPVAPQSAAPEGAAPRTVVPKTAAAKPSTPEAAAPRPAATPQPAAPKPAATPSAATSSGPWFVNFGSYAARSVAETWSGKLRPGAGKVIIAPIAKEGETLYRVRVVGLASRSSAQEVARQLEGQLRVSELWVGKE